MGSAKLHGWLLVTLIVLVIALVTMKFWPFHEQIMGTSTQPAAKK